MKAKLSEDRSTDVLALPDKSVDSEPKIDVGKAIRLRLINKLTYREIGEKLGVSKQAIHSCLSKIFKLLNNPDLVQAYRENKAELLDSVQLEIVSQLIDPDWLKKASANNLGYVFTQVENAIRLERGLSTANVAIGVVGDEERAFLGKLSAERMQEAIEAEYQNDI